MKSQLRNKVINAYDAEKNICFYDKAGSCNSGH
jgi:hypothetical protein